MAEKTLIIRKEDAGTALQTDCFKDDDDTGWEEATKAINK